MYTCNTIKDRTRDGNNGWAPSRPTSCNPVICRCYNAPQDMVGYQIDRTIDGNGNSNKVENKDRPRDGNNGWAPSRPSSCNPVIYLFHISQRGSIQTNLMMLLMMTMI